MTSQAHSVILVYSTSYALRAEKFLRKAGIRSKLIPVPRHLSSNCGVCIRIAQSDRDAAQRALQENGIEIEGVQDI